MRLIFAIFISFFLALPIFSGDKTSIGVFLSSSVILLYGLFCAKCGFDEVSKKLLYFIIFSIPFPILLQFLGRDAISVTTLLIYFLFISCCFNILTGKLTAPPASGRTLFIPIMIAMGITVSLFLNSSYLAQSIRNYVSNISGILLLITIFLIVRKYSEVVQIIKIVLISLTIQSSIAFLQWKFPETNNLFNIFGSRVFSPSAVIVDNVVRSRGTMWDYELLAEWFLLGAILSFCLLYLTKRIGSLMYFLSCFLGIVFTKTRSVFILLVIFFILMIMALKFFRKDVRAFVPKMIFIALIFGIISLILIREPILSYSERLNDYFASSHLISAEAINRKSVWDNAFSYLGTPKLFGSGLYNIESLPYSTAGSFHSLYLMMLYKFGIVGLGLHVIFWLMIFRKNIFFILSKTSDPRWYLVLFSSFCMLFLLLDETKIEYLRYTHTIEFAWFIYSLNIVSAGINIKGDKKK